MGDVEGRIGEVMTMIDVDVRSCLSRSAGTLPGYTQGEAECQYLALLT